MKKIVLVIGTIFLLICVNVVSSNKTVDNKYNTEEKISGDKIAYGCNSLNYDLVKFPLDDPGNMEIIAEGEFTYFLTGGAWTCDGEWYGCEYNSGGLWKIDPYTGEQENIGGGGTSCNDMSYDHINDRLYGAGSTGLYEYDLDTGEQEFIGSYGIEKAIGGMAINSEGVCYAWDVQFSGPSILYTVDLETGEATEVGSLIMSGMCGCFDYDTDLLYMIGGEMLIECDIDTGECTIVGNFGSEISCLTIPYNCSNIPPVTYISFDPPYPDGENGWYVSNVTATLNATDNDGVYRTFYRINGGDLKIYENPFVISEEGDNILIEYYSLDNMGNFEDIKSATIDIDKTPPNMTVEWDVEKVGLGWLVSFTIAINDNASGIDRLEIFLNGGIQSIVSGSGPTYSWSWTIYGPFSFKFIAYDIAGNYAVVVVNETDISYHNPIKDIFNHQSTYPFLLRLLESHPLLLLIFQKLPL